MAIDISGNSSPPPTLDPSSGSVTNPSGQTLDGSGDVIFNDGNPLIQQAWHDTSYVAVNFYLSGMDTTVTLDISGVIDSSYEMPFYCDAEATLDVSASAMQNIFMFSLSDQSLNDSPTDIRYYVITSGVDDFRTTPISTAVVDARPMTRTSRSGELLTSSEQMITFDFVRYLGYYCFGNHLGSNLFVNEIDLVSSVNDRFLEGFQKYVINSLYAVDSSKTAHNDFTGQSWSVTPPAWISSGAAASPYYAVTPLALDSGGSFGSFSTDSLDNNTNLCRELYLKLLNADPGRFNNIIVPSTGNYDVLQTLPLLPGDTICFKVTISVAENQSVFGIQGPTNTAGDNDRSQDRTYLIKLLLN